MKSTPSRLSCYLVAAVAGVVLTIAGSTDAALADSAVTATPQSSSVSTGNLSPEDVSALVGKSVVQMSITWTGYVYYPVAGGGSEWSKSTEANFSCTGFFVSSTGQFASAGHCVDPVGGRKGIIDVFLARQVENKNLTNAEAAGLRDSAYSSWKVESNDAGSPPIRVVQVRQPKNLANAVLKDPLVAQLQDFRPFDEGDVALLKVEASNTPALPVATQDPRVGSSLTAVGFPAVVGNVVNTSTIAASFKSGTASSQQISGTGVAQTEVNADISPGMSGGPTVDALGNALGVNSFRLNGETQAFNFITDTTDLHDWLTMKGVQLATIHEAASVTVPAKATITAVKPASEKSGISPNIWLILVVALAVVACLVFVFRRKLVPASGVSTGAAPSSDISGERLMHQPPSTTQAPAGNATQAPARKKHCEQCGTPAAASSRFCGECGSSLDNSHLE